MDYFLWGLINTLQWSINSKRRQKWLGKKMSACNTMSIYQYLEPTLSYMTKPMWLMVLKQRDYVVPSTHRLMEWCVAARGQDEGTRSRRESAVRVEAEAGWRHCQLCRWRMRTWAKESGWPVEARNARWSFLPYTPPNPCEPASDFWVPGPCRQTHSISRLFMVDCYGRGD